MTSAPVSFNDRLLELVSDRVGLIKELSFPTRGADEPCPPVICQATLSNFDFHRAEPAARVAAGKGRTEAEAMASAIGEAVEHYCAEHFDVSRTKRAAFASIDSAAVPPPELVLYSDAQYENGGFRYRRWKPEDELTWMPISEITTGAEVLVPASLIYLAPEPERRSDYLSMTTSSGLAAGPDQPSAIISGLYELIERDGFLIHWMNRLPPPEVVFPESAGLASSICNHYARFGVEVRVFNISTDLPAYVMMAIALDSSGGGPSATVGLGCHLDPSVAVMKALFELAQGHPGHLQRFREKRPAIKRYEDVHTLDDHSDFAAMPENRHEFDFIVSNGRRQDLSALPVRTGGGIAADMDICVRGLADLGYRTFYVDLTTPDVVDHDLRVVRVLATGLQPMHFGYGEERLGGKRLFETPSRLGFGPEIRTEADLNHCPHPLA